jgi:hypothetical protein
MPDITSFAAQKAFAELDPEQRAQVLAEMPSEEYDRLHTLLRAARSLDADVAPPPALGERLRARMASQTKSGGPAFPLRLLQFRLPAWQAAAAIVLALLAGRFFSADQTVEAPQIVVETRVVHDTIFQEKTIWKERLVLRWRTEPMAATMPDSIQLDVAPMENDPLLLAQPARPMDLESNPASVGVRLSEQPELLQFFTRPGEGER